MKHVLHHSGVFDVTTLMPNNYYYYCHHHHYHYHYHYHYNNKYFAF